MNDETVPAQAEGEVLPKVVATDPAVLARVSAAIDSWYAIHFNSAAKSGRAPITAEEKASLTAIVTEALTPKE